MNQPEPNPVGVLVVDDQASFRDGMRDLVAATEGFVLLGEAESGEAAVRGVERLAPHLVIMDKRMPGIGGMEATRRITSRNPDIVVILASVEDAPDEVVLSSCGAAGFMCKRDFSPAALVGLWGRIGVERRRSAASQVPKRTPPGQLDP